MDKKDLKEIKRIESAIKKALLSELDYVRKDYEREQEVVPNIDFGNPESRRAAREIPCVLWRWFKLSDCRAWTDKSESDDGLILKALDNLARSGKIRVLSIEFMRSMRFGDCGFHCELGLGVSDFSITDCMRRVTRLYFDEPPKKTERDECIVNISEAVIALRERQRKQLEEKFRKTDPHLESRLHREDLEAEAQYKSSVIKLARSLEAKDEKKV